MDFAGLPPEVNSTRMYAGPGAAPMMAAASAWSALGAELSTTAASCESVVATLTGEAWLGPSSVAMTAAAAPYVAWMNTTAAAAEHAAAQATASAAAYEAAFAMTVPPPVVFANRAQLATLVATNILGQNTPAIAANEALYAAMWVQDAVAMYGYAASSAAAGILQPLTPPTPTANPAAAVGTVASSGAQTGLTQVISGLPSAVQQLASPLAGSGFLTDAINSTQNIGLWNSLQTYGGAIGNIAAWNMFGGISAGVGLASAHSEAGILGGAGGAMLVGSTGFGGAPAGSASVGGTPVLASAGRAGSVGAMSVPATWSSATPASTAPSALTTAGWTAATEEGASVAAIPAGMPAVATAGRGGFGFGTPRYGFKPTVMPRPVAVG